MLNRRLSSLKCPLVFLLCDAQGVAMTAPRFRVGSESGEDPVFWPVWGVPVDLLGVNQEVPMPTTDAHCFGRTLFAHHAARRLCVSVRTVRWYVETGQLAAAR